MKSIVVVGDSFCASARTSQNFDVNTAHWVGQQFNPDRNRCSWLDQAAKLLDFDLYGFGYTGRSWYYSRWELFEYIQRPGWLDTVEVIVFCHSNHYRYNTNNSPINNAMALPDYEPDSDDDTRDQKKIWARALRYWTTDLIDPGFQLWAQIQWFHEIAREFSHIKQIHFNNFPDSVDSTVKILPGVVFTTPLIHVSLGECLGTDEEIVNNYILNDQRDNHLSSENNLALGNLVAETFQNYQPGSRPIDLTKFNIVNPNASRWPNPGFGTEDKSKIFRFNAN